MSEFYWSVFTLQLASLSFISVYISLILRNHRLVEVCKVEVACCTVIILACNILFYPIDTTSFNLHMYKDVLSFLFLFFLLLLLFLVFLLLLLHSIYIF